MSVPVADLPADLTKETREAAEAWAKYYSNRTTENLQAAIKESSEVYEAGKAAWSWQQIVIAVVVAVASLVTGISTVAVVSPSHSPAKVKDDPAPDIGKKIDDGFAKLAVEFAGMSANIKVLGEKIDAKPKPAPVPPTPAKPLSLPDTVQVTVGGAFVKIKAEGPSAINWYWPANDGIQIDKHGDTVYVSATKPGEYWIVAYTVKAGAVDGFAACRVTTNTAPNPPPGPTPPVPPTPKDWPTTAPGLRVLIVFEEMERSKLASGQRALIDGAPIRDWLDAKCVQDGAVKAWRIFDQNQGVQGAEKHWQEMMARKRASVPWCVICNYPKAYYEGVLPASVDEFKALIQKVE